MGGVLSGLLNTIGGFFGGLYLLGLIAFEPIVCFFNPGQDFFFYVCPRERTPVPAPTTPAPTPAPGPFNIRLINAGSLFQFNEEFQAAVERWEAVVVGDLPDIGRETFNVDMFDGRLSNEPIVEDVDDVTIGYELRNLGDSTIATSGPIFVRRTGSTITGFMQFDYRNMLDETAASRTDIITREIGSVLGIGTLWENSGCSRCNTANRTADYLCDGANEAYRNLTLGPNIGTGDILQLSPTCRYWSADSFNATDYTDIMVRDYDPSKQQLITAATVASLSDIGDYVVNLDAADPIPTTRRTLRKQQ